jgi:serine/threonine-protein phosphatase 6 regulatory ankyrin repeat subunit B
VNLLLFYGAEINHGDKCNQRPIDFAMKHDHYPVVRLLVKNNANLEQMHEFASSALHFAAEIGDIELVRMLLEKDVEVDQRKLIPSNEAQIIGFGSKYSRGGVLVIDSTTPLLLACAGKKVQHKEIVEILVETGKADVNQASECVWSTPAIIAAKYKNLNILKYLVSKNADISKRISGGKNAFLMACLNGHIDVVTYLLVQLGPTVINEADGCGRSALYLAAANGHLNVVKFLAEKGANLEQQTCLKGEPDEPEINTPFLVSRENKHREVEKYLKKKIEKKRR